MLLRTKLIPTLQNLSKWPTCRGKGYNFNLENFLVQGVYLIKYPTAKTTIGEDYSLWQTKSGHPNYVQRRVMNIIAISKRTSCSSHHKERHLFSEQNLPRSSANSISLIAEDPVKT